VQRANSVMPKCKNILNPLCEAIKALRAIKEARDPLLARFDALTAERAELEKPQEATRVADAVSRLGQVDEEVARLRRQVDYLDEQARPHFASQKEKTDHLLYAMQHWVIDEVMAPWKRKADAAWYDLGEFTHVKEVQHGLRGLLDLLAFSSWQSGKQSELVRIPEEVWDSITEDIVTVAPFRELPPLPQPPSPPAPMPPRAQETGAWGTSESAVQFTPYPRQMRAPKVV